MGLQVDIFNVFLINLFQPSSMVKGISVLGMYICVNYSLAFYQRNINRNSIRIPQCLFALSLSLRFSQRDERNEDYPNSL